MVSVPVDFTAEGTDAETVGSAVWVGMTVVGSATLEAVVDGAAVVVGLLELLEHAAPRTATALTTVATATFRNPRGLDMRRPPLAIIDPSAKCGT